MYNTITIYISFTRIFRITPELNRRSLRSDYTASQIPWEEKRKYRRAPVSTDSASAVYSGPKKIEKLKK
jgi:hypothetical protein